MNPALHRAVKLIVVAISLPVILAACGKSPEQHFERAQALSKKADYKAAVIELKTVLQKQPDNREARLLLGEIALQMESYAVAEKELSKARSLGAPDEQTLPALAKVYVKMGEPQKALELGMPPATLPPRSLAEFHAIRAGAQLSLGKRAEAEESIRAASQADPNQPELLLIQAKLSLVDKQIPQAQALIDASIKSDPKFTEAYFLKAMLLESENKSDEATYVYQQILANDPTQFRAHLALANLQMKKGDMEAADKAIQSAEKLAGKAPMVKYARGILELRREKPEKASDSLLDVLRVAPNHLPSMLAYAMASYSLGHYEQSINYAGKVLGAVPNNPIAAKIRAGSLLKTGDIDGAIKTLTPLLSRYPEDSGLMSLAGEVYLQAKDYNKAMGYLNRASELDPKNATIKTRLAAGHLAGGESGKAMADLEAAASLSDKPGQADLTLVMLHLKGKEYDKALQAIASLEKKLPNNPVTHNLRAAALLGKQDKAGARKEFEQALAIDPKFLPAALNLARLDMADKKPEAARKRFESILEKDKNNIQAMLALADLAAANKQEQEHVAWLEKASKAQPNALQPKDRLIRFYLAKKDDKKAIATARDALSINPDDPKTLDMMGSTQVATGDLKGAIDTFTKLTEKAHSSPEAFQHLGMAQMVDKQFSAARTSLERALKIKPDHIQTLDMMLRLELTEKKPDAALLIARKIQAQQPKSPTGFDREADILLSQKRAPEAIKAYELALGRGAGAITFVKLHRTLILADDVKGADQRLKAWLQTHPEDHNMRLYAARQYMGANRNREAIAMYEVISQKAPNHVVALNNLATLYQQEKDKRALATAEQAYKLGPESPEVQDTLGWILIEQGQLPRGLDLLGKAAAKLPKAATVRYHYGVALIRSGKKLEAKKELEAAVANEQKFPELEEAKTLLKGL